MSGVAERPNRNKQIVALREAGVGPREIARQLGLAAGIISGVLHRAGMTRGEFRRGGRQNASPEFQQLVVDESFRSTWREASEKWGVPRSTIAHWRRLRDRADMARAEA